MSTLVHFEPSNKKKASPSARVAAWSSRYSPTSLEFPVQSVPWLEAKWGRSSMLPNSISYFLIRKPKACPSRPWGPHYLADISDCNTLTIKKTDATGVQWHHPWAAAIDNKTIANIPWQVRMARRTMVETVHDKGGGTRNKAEKSIKSWRNGYAMGRDRQLRRGWTGETQLPTGGAAASS